MFAAADARPLRQAGTIPRAPPWHHFGSRRPVTDAEKGAAHGSRTARTNSHTRPYTAADEPIGNGIHPDRSCPVSRRWGHSNLLSVAIEVGRGAIQSGPLVVRATTAGPHRGAIGRELRLWTRPTHGSEKIHWHRFASVEARNAWLERPPVPTNHIRPGQRAASGQSSTSTDTCDSCLRWGHPNLTQPGC